MGTMPMIMASAVMMTGRKRVKPASRAACGASPPLLSSCSLAKRDDQDRVGGRDAHAHDGAGKCGHAQVGAGDEEHPHDPGESSEGNAATMMKGSSHDWKLTTISR